MTPCEACGRLPIDKDPAAADALLAAIRRADVGRLGRTESLLSGVHEEDRLAVANWLGGMLRRAPLNSGARAWAAIAAFVDALWWDISDSNPDDLSPVVEGWTVPATHPRLMASHPWGADEQ